MCGARRGTLSQREKVTGRAFDRQIGSTKRGDRYADFRIRTGFSFDRHIRYATGDGKWSSGESRLSKLSRHEATIERALYKAHHELLRLQAQRRGESGMVPQAVDVQVDRSD